MLIAATFNRGKYMYKSREGGCATAEQKHRTAKGICPPPPIPPCILVAICLGCSLKISLQCLSLLLLDFTEAGGS